MATTKQAYEWAKNHLKHNGFEIHSSDNKSIIHYTDRNGRTHAITSNAEAIQLRAQIVCLEQTVKELKTKSK